MDKEVFGQPVWLWGIGLVVVVGGYLYFRSHSASSSAPGTGQGQGGTGKDVSQSSFKEWITQHSAPSGTHKQPHKRGGFRGP